MSKLKHEPSTLPLATEGFKPSNTPEPATSAAAQESPKQARQGSIVQDRELVAMNAIAKVMGPLDDQERARVLSWVVAKYRSAAFMAVYDFRAQPQDQSPPSQ